MVNEFPLTKLIVIESVILPLFRALSRIAAESFPPFQSFRLDRNPSSNPESIRDQTSWNDKNKIGNNKQNKNIQLKILVSRNSFDKHS
jgi:hypothetical protein